MLSQNFITILNLVTITFFAKPQANITVSDFSLSPKYKKLHRYLSYICPLIIFVHIKGSDFRIIQILNFQFC